MCNSIHIRLIDGQQRGDKSIDKQIRLELFHWNQRGNTVHKNYITLTFSYCSSVNISKSLDNFPKIYSFHTQLVRL